MHRAVCVSLILLPSHKSGLGYAVRKQKYIFYVTMMSNFALYTLHVVTAVLERPWCGNAGKVNASRLEKKWIEIYIRYFIN